jgi:DNA recombination protein RmuC
MEILIYGLIILLLITNLYFVTRKETDEDKKDDEYLIKGIVSEIIENEESQIYKLLNKSDQTVKEFLEKTGEIKSSITGVDQQTRNLISVLNNNQSRGQWAEFQVEDLLEIMEYKEGIHYETQKRMASGTIPDFTFFLPENKTINMDSKFPLTNYMEIAKLNRDLENETLDEIARREIIESIKNKNKEFLDKAIKTKIDETSSREGYISAEEGTVDFVLMYIPLENLYHFLLTSEIGANRVPVIQYAFSKKVILVSPQTLMAYLETIRHSMKLFSLQTDTKNILATHEKVKIEIRKFIESFDDVTKRLDQTVKSFDTLKTTRVNKLEKSFEELDSVNKELED